MPLNAAARLEIRGWVQAVAAAALIAGGLPLGAAVLVSPAQL